MLAARSGLSRSQVQFHAFSACLQLYSDQVSAALPRIKKYTGNAFVAFALAGFQLVHQRPRSAVEADDRGDVRGSQEGLGRNGGCVIA